MAVVLPIKDKSNTLFGLAIEKWQECQTMHDKQQFVLNLHSTYYKVLDMFMNDLNNLAPVESSGKPISHVKPAVEEFAAKAPFAVRGVVEPSGKVAGRYTGKTFQTYNGELGSPLVPKKGEIVEEGYFSRRGDKPTVTRPDAKLLTSTKPFTGKSEVITLLARAAESARQHHHKGIDNCQICGEHQRTFDYTLNGFKWPASYHHYISAHNVMPTAGFAAMLLNVTSSRATIAVRHDLIAEEVTIKKAVKKKAVKVAKKARR